MFSLMSDHFKLRIAAFGTLEGAAHNYRGSRSSSTESGLYVQASCGATGQTLARERAFCVFSGDRQAG